MRRKTTADRAEVIAVGRSAACRSVLSGMARRWWWDLLEECPWKQMGVAEPLAPSQNQNESFFITRPIYSGSKPTTAKVSFEYSIARDPAAPQRGPFIHRQTCSFEKREPGWLLLECKTDIIP